MLQIISIIALVASMCFPATNMAASIVIVATMIIAMSAPDLVSNELFGTWVYVAVNATALSALQLSPIVHMFVLKMVLGSVYKQKMANAYLSSIYLHFIGYAIASEVIHLFF